MKTVTAVVLLLLASTAAAESEFDGQEWNGWSTASKTMYLVGWIDGRAEGTWDAIAALDKKLFSKGDAALDDPRLQSLQAGVTVGQLLVGVNEFYKDYKNLNIGVRTAVSVVDEQISGKEVTEEWLQGLRQIEAQRSAKRRRDQ